jgi:hypothetical protein
VDPRYTLIDDGEGNDDHPHADLRAGESDTAVPVLPVIPEPVPTLCGQGGIWMSEPRRNRQLSITALALDQRMATAARVTLTASVWPGERAA